MREMPKSDMADRRALLDENREKLIKAMKESGFRDPIGIVADTRDNVGRRIVKTALLATGRTEQEADDHILAMSMEMAKKGLFLTGLLVVDWKTAEALLPLTSPTATETLQEVKRVHEVEKKSYMMVAVGSGGNTYTLIEIDDMPPLPQHVEDGQHRVTGFYVPKQ